MIGVLPEACYDFITVEHLAFSLVVQLLEEALSIDGVLQGELVLGDESKTGENSFGAAVGGIGHRYLLASSLEDGILSLRSQRCRQQCELGIVLAFLAEIVFEQKRCYSGNDGLLALTHQLGRGKRLLPALIKDLDACGEIAVEKVAQFLEIRSLEGIIVHSLGSRRCGTKGFCGCIPGELFLKFVGYGVQADINAVRLRPHADVLLIEDRHEVDIEILLGLGR